MSTKLITVWLLAVAFVTGAFASQNAKEQPPARNASPTTVSDSSRYISAANIQIELSIADYLGKAAPQTKTVSMLVAEGYMGRVRSQRSGNTFLNVDATPRLQKDGRISLQLIVEYRPRETAETLDAMSPINEMLTVLLQSGKPLVVTQAADPSSDRKVTVEVTATILK